MIDRLKFLYIAIKNKVYYDLATILYYFSNKEGKQIDRQEVIGEAKGGPPPPIEILPMIKRVTTKPIIYSALISYSILEYNSN